jgi:hypothetical protein
MAQDTYHFPATVVATKTFTAEYDGDQVEITAGMSRLVGDHEIVRQHPDAFRSLGPDPEPPTPEEAFARYGMDAALEHLVEIVAYWEHHELVTEAIRRAGRQPTAEQRDEALRRLAQRREALARTAFTRARTRIMAAARLSGGGAAARPIVRSSRRHRGVRS